MLATPIATAAAAQLVGERRDHARAGAGDRVAEAAAAAVHVDDLVGKAEDPARRDRHRRERLVDLDERDVADLEAGTPQRLRDRDRGAETGVGRRHARRRPGAHDGQRLEPVRLRVVGVGEHERAAAVVEARRVPRGDREAGDLRVQRRSAASFSTVVSRRGCSSTSKMRTSPFPTGISRAKISSLNRPSSVAATARMCEWYAQWSMLLTRHVALLRGVPAHRQRHVHRRCVGRRGVTGRQPLLHTAVRAGQLLEDLRRDGSGSRSRPRSRPGPCRRGCWPRRSARPPCPTRSAGCARCPARRRGRARPRRSGRCRRHPGGPRRGRCRRRRRPGSRSASAPRRSRTWRGRTR